MELRGESGRIYRTEGQPRVGGQAEIWRAQDGVGCIWAVKLARGAGEHSARLEREYGELARLQDSHRDLDGWVVPIEDRGRDAVGRFFLVLPWFERSLADWVVGRSLEDRLLAAERACAAVLRLHRSERDVARAEVDQASAGGAERITELESELAASVALKAGVEQRLSVAVSQLEALAGSSDEAAGLQARIDDLEGELAEERQAIEVVKENAEQVLATVQKALENEQARSDEADTKARALERQLADVQSKLALVDEASKRQLEAVATARDRAAESAARYDREHARAERAVEAVKQTRAALAAEKARVAELEAAAREASSPSDEIAELQAELDRSQKELTLLARLKATVDDTMLVMDNELVRARSRAQAEGDAATELARELDLLRAASQRDIAELGEERDTLARRLAELEAEHRTLQALAAGQIEAHAELSARVGVVEVDDGETAPQPAAIQLGTEDAQGGDLAVQLHEAHEEIERLHAQLEERGRTSRVSRIEAIEARDEVRKLGEQLEQATRRADALAGQLTAQDKAAEISTTFEPTAPAETALRERADALTELLQGLSRKLDQGLTDWQALEGRIGASVQTLMTDMGKPHGQRSTVDITSALGDLHKLLTSGRSIVERGADYAKRATQAVEQGAPPSDEG